ncbi:uncharacterized protein [Physcomitrium patens]|uniref:uncharacterized protein n=1 Tax=Physcomitrium patens TaxID=3218 RepID=UPI003CCCE48D
MARSRTRRTRSHCKRSDTWKLRRGTRHARPSGVNGGWVPYLALFCFSALQGSQLCKGERWRCFSITRSAQVDLLACIYARGGSRGIHIGDDASSVKSHPAVIEVNCWVSCFGVQCCGRVDRPHQLPCGPDRDFLCSSSCLLSEPFQTHGDLAPLHPVYIQTVQAGRCRAHLHTARVHSVAPLPPPISTMTSVSARCAYVHTYCPGEKVVRLEQSMLTADSSKRTPIPIGKIDEATHHP